MKSSYMHRSALALAATFALAACGPRDDANNAAGGSAVAGGDVAATTPAPGMTGDSAAMGAGAGASAGAVGAAGAMSAANIMSVVGVANANEIGSSKIAQEKATNGDVKSFANDMVKEHQAMQQDADQLATQLNVTPQPADRAQQMKNMGEEMINSLQSTAKGAAFDRAYMQGQVQAHQATLDELTALQNAASEEQVRTLITNAIPKVRQHLERAQRIQGQLGS